MRGRVEIRLQDPLELDQRLLVEDDVVEVGGGDAGFRQAVPDGVPRVAEVVLLPGEPLLLSGGDDVAVLDQGGRAVVVEG